MPAKPQCLACLRNPAHQVDNEDGTITLFCEEHWGRVLDRLLELGPRYKALVDRGVDKQIAVARLSAEIQREYAAGGDIAAGEDADAD